MFSWLVIPNQPCIDKEDLADEMKEEKNAALKTQYCKDCWKDLIDILITFLYDSTKCQRKSLLEGKLFVINFSFYSHRLEPLILDLLNCI